MQTVTVLSYTFGTQGNTQDWFIINDGVMGGLSKGELTQLDSTTIFSGEVSLENNGGFTAFRSPYGVFNLSEYKTVTVKARGSGQVIGFSLQMDRAYYAPYYRVSFRPQPEWQEYSFDLSTMPAMRLGEDLGYTISADDLTKIIRIGFITTEKSAGSFKFEVESIVFSK